MIRNIISRNGNAIANQFIVTTSKGTFFQSYNSVVCKIDRNGKVTLGKNWDYSATTMKYLRIFLEREGGYYLTSKEIRKAVEDKEFAYKARLSM